MKKKLVVLGLAGAIFLSGMGILNVSAANYSDTKFSFTLGKLGANDYTGSRQKQNTTSSYVKLNSIGKGTMCHFRSYFASVLSVILHYK
ncbi:TPA: hypothetical protein ACSZKW_09255 [Listeria monocytogenes]